MKQVVLIHLVHIFILGMLLLYVGIEKPKKDWLYYVLLALGIIIILKFLSQWKKEDPFWIVWHTFVGIVLISVGIKKRHSFAFQYKLLIILGSAAIGYHAIRLAQHP